jgi:hypothetical protein
MEYNYCKYCEKNFVFKDIYEQHLLTCNFFYKKHKEKDRKQDIDNDYLPSQREMYRLIQYLAIKCDKLEKEMQKIKTKSNITCKNDILHVLNLNAPSICFKDWLKNIQITKLELQEVFNENLTHGIKFYFENQIDKELLNFPLRAFKEKPNTLFMFVGTQECTNSTKKPKKKETALFKEIVSHNKNSWETMTNEDFEKMINLIIHKYIVEFSLWQENNEHLFKNSDKEKIMNYMLKIHNIKVNETKQKTEIKKWLVAKLEKNSVELYDEDD